MIGMVVGNRPFGGGGVSGTRSRAGRPNYLGRFTGGQVVTVNTAAAGGNAGLPAQDVKTGQSRTRLQINRNFRTLTQLRLYPAILEGDG